jgi:hypothetical protein
MNNALKHHGIMGMKWGVIRDKTQLSRAEGSSKSRSEDKSKKKVKGMSDDELRKAVNRLQMERQYSQLSESKIRKGEEYVKKVAEMGTAVAAISTSALVLYNNAEKIKKITSA